jgi:hypothetical protein
MRRGDLKGPIEPGEERPAVFETEPGRRTAAKLLARDETRRIAANIAKLPELLETAAVLEASATRPPPMTPCH